jgi:hypothetical protein
MSFVQSTKGMNMKGKTILIAVDGTETVVNHIAPPTLEFMQQAVGGYIEKISMFNEFRGEACFALCNEEGKLQDLPYNAKATEHWAAALNGQRLDDMLCGPILIICGDNEFLAGL